MTLTLMSFVQQVFSVQTPKSQFASLISFYMAQLNLLHFFHFHFTKIIFIDLLLVNGCSKNLSLIFFVCFYQIFKN